MKSTGSRQMTIAEKNLEVVNSLINGGSLDEKDIAEVLLQIAARLEDELSEDRPSYRQGLVVQNIRDLAPRVAQLYK